MTEKKGKNLIPAGGARSKEEKVCCSLEWELHLNRQLGMFLLLRLSS